MELGDVLNPVYQDPLKLRDSYVNGDPFPHIVLPDFLNTDLLNKVADEFPDLALAKTAVKQFNNDKEVKFSSQGMALLSPNALLLNSYLQSDLMLNWLNELTGIDEPLISDPYLAGGGYHEIKAGGLLKIHADFNKHPKLNLDRRLNMIIYLNNEWQENWGGGLQLFDRQMDKPIKSVVPNFNTAIIFSTTSYTYHGHPDPLACPESRSRRSLAYYYFSTGRPQNEVSGERHSTIFKERKGENFNKPSFWKRSIIGITPPIVTKLYMGLRKKDRK